MCKFLVALLALVPLLKADTASAPTLDAPFSNELTASVVASGLNFPTAMAIAPNGSLLVGTTAPSGGSGQFNYYLGQGQLLDISGGNTTQVASFPGAITAVTTIGSDILVSTTGNGPSSAFQDSNIYLLSGTDYSVLGNISADLPPGGGAPNISFTVQNANTVLFSLSNGGGSYTLSGSLSGTLNAGTIYSMTVNPQGGPLFSQPTEIADDTRNIGGMTFDQSGNLFFTDNGTEPAQACPNDQIDEIPAGTSGISDEGFYTTCTPSTGLVATFPGISGIYQVVLSPFGGSLAGGLFAGFDGDYNSTGVDNATDDLLYIDPATGTWQVVIAGGQAGTGHPIGVLSADGTLYVANFNLNGDPSQPDQTWQGGTGDIIAIAESVPEPGSALLLLAGIAAVYSRARVRRGRSINCL